MLPEIEFLPDMLTRVIWLSLIEGLLFCLALCLAFIIPERIIAKGWKFPRWLEIIIRQPKLAVFLVGLVAFIGSMTVSLLVRFPLPYVQDEFSYLLAADTFAHGRLANLPHPLWKHFEAIQIVQQPAYASKYPPAQGLVLALGQVSCGHPVIGVWVAIALACAAICWMLQAWLPRRWAFLGGLIAAMNLGFFGYWSQKYWGGALAATGGALLFGSLRRLVQQPTIGAAIWMATGLVLLANSRPLEGMVVSLPAVIVILSHKCPGGGRSWRIWLVQVVAPICLIVSTAAVWMAYYNLRVTGSLWRLPYQVYESQYASGPIFLWSPKPSLTDRSLPQIFIDVQRSFYQKKEELQTVAGFIKEKSKDLTRIGVFYLRVVFLVPLVLLPWILRNRWNRFASLVVSSLIALVLLETQSWPRKMAPAACLLIFLGVQCLRHLRLWRWRGRPTGRCLVWLMLAIFLTSVLISFLPVLQTQGLRLESRQRSTIERQLEEDAHNHLIIVKSWAPDAKFDWIYNRADIDSAKVIWARDLGPAENRKLVDYYRDRKIWLIEPQCFLQSEPRLKPYSNHR